MLTILLGTDWTANRDAILNMVANDVAQQAPRRILLVPELISHDMECRLCDVAGDTSSRFAEVLSFTRLTRRVCDWSGVGIPKCLDNGGRLVAMAAATRQLHSQLKAYAAVETRPEFLSGLVDAVDEFKRCCISAEDLNDAAKKTSGAFAQKLQELSLILGAYDGISSHGFRDPRDLLTWTLEQLQDSDFAQNHVFYIDGFPDFTRQNMAIITHLIQYAPNVVISMNCDSPDSGNLAYEKSAQTTANILRIAKECCIPVVVRTVESSKKPLNAVTNFLFQGKILCDSELSQILRLVQAENVYDECVLAAEYILSLIHNGARYNEIGIVCPDLSTYANALNMQLNLCGIPAYIAGTEDILENSAISTVLTALDCALGGFDQKDVLRYLKSALSPVDLEVCDELENYAIMWNIHGLRWLDDWSAHPSGLQEVWQAQDTAKLNELNCARAFVMNPLKELYSGFKNASKLSDQVNTLYQFLNAIQLDVRLQQFALEMDAAGDNRNAQILNQHWDILLSALEQLDDMLGETKWDNDIFSRLFRLLLSQYDVGTIPTVLDSIMIGPVSSMRCQQVKHLLVIGAAEGSFPGYGSISGVLSDYERNELRQMGIPLTGGAAEGLQIEFSEIYGVFCGADSTIYVSCPSGQGAFVYRRLYQMVGCEYVAPIPISAIAVNESEAAAFLCRTSQADTAEFLGLSASYDTMRKKCAHTLGNIQPDAIEKLYGKRLNLSASQVDKQAECRLSYFLKYGLRAKERKAVSVDPAEFGTFVHAVLEETAREITNNGGFKAVSLEQTLEIAQKYSQQYIQEHFKQIDSQRISYLFRRNDRELMMVVEELWAELQNSSFVPIDFEVAFGDGQKLAAIPIDGKTISAQLSGFVDRVDAWQEAGRNYYRVVDYKTGKKDFDYCDIFNGLGLQMLLYLFALKQQGENLLGEHPVPAGVQYFPARVPIISVDGVLSDEEAAEERQSLWKRKGLILEDEDVLFAMENSETPTRLSCKRKKDGTISGDIASKEQFQLLSRYVFSLLGKMADEIASGDVTPNPYTRGSAHNACRFCPYGAVCHSATVEGRRNYQTVSAQRFWEEIKKEMDNHG